MKELTLEQKIEVIEDVYIKFKTKTNNYSFICIETARTIRNLSNELVYLGNDIIPFFPEFETFITKHGIKYNKNYSYPEAWNIDDGAVPHKDRVKYLKSFLKELKDKL